MLRGLLLVAVTLSLVAFGAQLSSAASPGLNGRIVFEHIGESGGARIYSMTSRGTKRHLLTRARGASGRSPSYSPGGRRIVFVRAFKESDLWLMRSDGSHKRQLTRTRNTDEADPSWSPDRREIVFAVTRPKAQHGIWVLGTDGSQRRQLTSGVDGDPSWSPDGSEIAFDRYDAGTQTFGIFVLQMSGGPPMRLPSDPGVSDLQSDWSPDGSRILFTSDRPDTFQLDLWTMNADGSGVERVTDTPGRDEHDPVWSPDGRRIAYVGQSSSHGASSYQLYVSSRTGSSPRKITHACGECAINNDEPSWQPLR